MAYIVSLHALNLNVIENALQGGTDLHVIENLTSENQYLRGLVSGEMWTYIKSLSNDNLVEIRGDFSRAFVQLVTILAAPTSHTQYSNAGGRKYRDDFIEGTLKEKLNGYDTFNFIDRPICRLVAKDAYPCWGFVTFSELCELSNLINAIDITGFNDSDEEEWGTAIISAMKQALKQNSDLIFIYN